MSVDFSREIFFLISAALIGGTISRMAKLQPVVGYIVAGIAVRAIFPGSFFGVEKITELGLIFLLFSIGLELSISKLARVFKVSVMGAGIQIFLVTLLSFIVLRAFGLNSLSSFILSLGFSLSSTAIVVKMLFDKGEVDSLHGEIMVGWLIVQDLAVIPMMIILDNLKLGIGIDMLWDVVRAIIAIFLTVVFSKFIIPILMRFISSYNSRELMVLGAVFMATGIALGTYYLGVSLAIGAFIAGIVISETEEKHAVFAEVRPLRDFFVGIFFVSLGLLVEPGIFTGDLGMIIILTVIVILIKLLVSFTCCLVLGYHGKTAVLVGTGLSQIGEFSFVLYSFSATQGLISDRILVVGISTALFSLIIVPLIYQRAQLIWLWLRNIAAKHPLLARNLLGYNRLKDPIDGKEMKNHIIICGYGRVGKWVCRAVESLGIPYIVIEYNQSTVKLLRSSGVSVIYGDSSEKEILEAAKVNLAKAIVVAIPDRLAQETIITQVQTMAPLVKIISRVHNDEEWERLKILKIQKIVQPEFEAAIAIIRSILVSMGKEKGEVGRKIKSIRSSRAMSL